MFTNFAENRIVDAVFRGQTLGAPATFHIALLTADPTDAGTLTEVSGGSYARVAIASSLVNWSGTQGAGTTVASTGTSGQISNNIALNYPTPTANWGNVTHIAFMDAASGGNAWVAGALTASRNCVAGVSVSWDIGQMILTVG
jgi:hypothetical protein